MRRNIYFFLLIYIAIIPLGTIAHVELVWHLADLALAFMVATNMIGIIGLSETVFAEAKKEVEVLKENQQNQ